MFWRQFHGTTDKGVSLDAVKKMLASLCAAKQVEYSEVEFNRVLAKLLGGKDVPKELNFEQFRVFFATALTQKDFDLSESLAADSLLLSQNTHHTNH